MTLPNRITLGRLVLALVLFVLLAFAEQGGGRDLPLLVGSFLLFIVVAATDALDGYYARKLHLTSDFGRMADPAVDKILVCGSLIFLAAASWARPVLAPWMVVAIVAREFIVTGLRGYIESLGVRFPADWSGKLKMILQCIAVPGVLLYRIAERAVPNVEWAVDGMLWLARVIVWLTIALTIWSALDYVSKATRIVRERR